jgi:hypothetical protein
MSNTNKGNFKKACDLFNSKDWKNLKGLLADDVRVVYLNPKTPITNTSNDFITYQETTKADVKETFTAVDHHWNSDETGVVGYGTWQDSTPRLINIAFAFTFSLSGKINWMWGAPVSTLE